MMSPSRCPDYPKASVRWDVKRGVFSTARLRMIELEGRGRVEIGWRQQVPHDERGGHRKGSIIKRDRRGEGVGLGDVWEG